VEGLHRNKGYHQSTIINPATGSGWHIAYHFLIGKDGTVLQARSVKDRSGHTSCGLGFTKCVGEQNVNDNSLSISLAGDFTLEQPTKKQLASLKDLINRLDATYNFKRIIGHRDASPTACPGNNLMNALEEMHVLRNPKDIFQVSRYYTPVRGQERYYRDSYEADFKVNCQGDCLAPADPNKRYSAADASKVAACPPQYPFGTRFDVEGIGIVTCHDHGGAIQGNRLDIWTGIGMEGLKTILTTSGGPRMVKIL
jgi:hypothetical protein